MKSTLSFIIVDCCSYSTVANSTYIFRVLFQNQSSSVLVRVIWLKKRDMFGEDESVGLRIEMDEIMV